MGINERRFKQGVILLTQNPLVGDATSGGPKRGGRISELLSHFERSRLKAHGFDGGCLLCYVCKLLNNAPLLNYFGSL